jgi:hypothetical protein
MSAIPGSIEEYKNRLKHHDWYYDYSDDGSVWRRGSAERSALNDFQEKFDPLAVIWNSLAPEDFKKKTQEQLKKDLDAGLPAKEDIPKPETTIIKPRRLKL